MFKYFRLRFGVVNSTNSYLKLKIRVMDCGLPLYKIYFVFEKLVLKRYKKIIFLIFYNIESNLGFKKKRKKVRSVFQP